MSNNKKTKLKRKYKLLLIIILVIIILLFGINRLFMNNVVDNSNDIINLDEEVNLNEEDVTDDSNNIDNTQVTNDTNKDNNSKEIDSSKIDDNTKSSSTSNDNVVNNDKVYPKLSVINGTKEVIGTSSKGYEIYNIDGVTYVDGIMIANKSYGLPSTYVPINTYQSITSDDSMCKKCIDKTAYNAFLDMKNDASSIGLDIYISSGYRPYKVQERLYNNYVSRDGKEKADTYSSRAGHSDHQTGYAFDLNSINDSFTSTDEGKWINNNCYLYGFVIRFPKDKSQYTGYKYESWHLRYVGSDLAKILYNNGNWLSIEEYYGIDSVYSD